jgi:hypothetical protein
MLCEKLTYMKLRISSYSTPETLPEKRSPGTSDARLRPTYRELAVWPTRCALVKRICYSD